MATWTRLARLRCYACLNPKAAARGKPRRHGFSAAISEHLPVRESGVSRCSLPCSSFFVPLVYEYIMMAVSQAELCETEKARARRRRQTSTEREETDKERRTSLQCR